MNIIAMQVEIKIKLHSCLEFRNLDKHMVDQQKNIFIKHMGNITKDSEFTFEYRLKSVKKLLQIKELDLTELKSLPF